MITLMVNAVLLVDVGFSIFRCFHSRKRKEIVHGMNYLVKYVLHAFFAMQVDLHCIALRSVPPENRKSQNKVANFLFLLCFTTAEKNKEIRSGNLAEISRNVLYKLKYKLPQASACNAILDAFWF